MPHTEAVMARLLDLLLPPACAACDARGAVVCDRCLAAIRPLADPRDRFVLADPSCYVGEQVILGMAAFAYEGPVRRALHRLKYAGARDVAAVLADRAQPVGAALFAITGPATLLPVPATPERERRRGYNQAELVARAVGAAARMPAACLLARSRDTAAQHRLDRAARRSNLRGAIGLRPGASVPERVILVDDILTTGATLEACAEALLAAGAREAYAFAIAREV